MIVQAFNYATAHYFGDALAEQGRLRKRFCIDNRNWERLHSKGMEYDEFDTPAAWYFVCRDNTGKVRGCNRMIPTSDEFMIEKLWPDMVTEAEMPKTSAIWEQSRFCVDDELTPKEKGYVIANLLVALEDFNAAMDIEEIWWMALPENIQFLGDNAEPLGPQVNINGDMCFVGRSVVSKPFANRRALSKFGLPERGVLQWLHQTDLAA